MNDRLSTLLRDGADSIDVPPMPRDLVATGRRDERRRRARAAVAGAVAAVLVVVGASFAVDRWRDGGDSIQPAEQLAYEQRGAWISDGVVHIGDRTVEVPDARALVYTSEGALVASTDMSSDGPLEVDYILVRPDGRTQDLGVLGSIAADAGSPEVVYAEPAEEQGYFQLQVLDVSTGDTRPLGAPYASQDGSGLGRSGQHVVFTRSQRMQTIDMETGVLARLPQEEIGFSVDWGFGPAGYITAPVTGPVNITEWHVRSMPDGNLVGSYPDAGGQFASVSPDGRYLLTSSETSAFVYDVATGEQLPLELTLQAEWWTGWTPDGHVLTVGGEGTVEVCEPTTGECSDTGEPAGDNLSLERGSFNSWS